AAEMAFERAAELRDTIEQIQRELGG
ncbi:MAG: hypothetical protein COV99_03645, partial [Bacteroidetes bacterium CG12_big_fil_rev_8_21_14_0_65_60_17]